MKFRPKLDAFRDILGSRSDDGFVTPGNAITRAIEAPLEADLLFDTLVIGAASQPAVTAHVPVRAELPPAATPAPAAPAPAAAAAPVLIDGLDELADIPWTPPAIADLPDTEDAAAAILADPAPTPAASADDHAPGESSERAA
ncbi:MAG: hypothetical protein IT303_11845 [Dehalococcoidia bacterium]|nr:hypothetical protein [Dehalococcoidia bacterium]